MGLEFDRIRAGGGNGIDEGMRHPQAAIVRLRHLADHQAGGVLRQPVVHQS